MGLANGLGPGPPASCHKARARVTARQRRGRRAVLNGIVLIGVVGVLALMLTELGRPSHYSRLAGAGVGPSPTATGSFPPDKQAIIDEDNRLAAAGASNAPPKPTNPMDLAPSPSSEPTGPIRTGIMDANPPFPNVMYEIENQWAGIQGDEAIIVYAGSEGYGGDLSQGILVVRTQPANDLQADWKLNEFPTPSKHGAVTVTAADGLILTLSATDGTTFTFDAGTDTYK